MIDSQRLSQYRGIEPPVNHHNVAIHNVCGKFTLSSTSLHLTLLSRKMMNTSFNRKRLPALIIRKRNPRSTIILFKTGRGLIVGLDQCDAIQIVVNKLAKELTRVLNEGKIVVKQFEITNIMAVCQLGFKVNMGKLSQDRWSIKNENISGVIFRFGAMLKKSIIHGSGKVIICGLKTVPQLFESFALISNHLQKYKLFQYQKDKDDEEINYLMS